MIGSNIDDPLNEYQSQTHVVTETLYDDFGRRIGVRENLVQSDPRDHSTRFDKHADVRTTNYAYNPGGALVATTLPLLTVAEGVQKRPRYEYQYDVYGNQIGMLDNAYEFVDKNIEPLANRVYYYQDNQEELGPIPYTEFRYDDAGRQTARVLPEGTKTPNLPRDYMERSFYGTEAMAACDTSPNCANLSASLIVGQLGYHIDFEGRLTKYLYDNRPGANGRLVKEYYYYGTPALTAFTEAPDPTIISADLWDASNTSAGRQYFKDGSLKSVDTTRAAQTSGISAYTYDALGRLKTVAGATDVTTYFYDPHGNLARTEQQTTATDKIFADYAYDGMSRLESVVHTKSNNNAEDEISTYDYQLRLDGRRSRAVETREENHSAENTIVITWAYDELGRLVREDRRSQASINSLNDTTETLYFYDLVGNRTKTEQRSDGSLTLLQLFTYDGNDRLKVFSTGDAAAATTQFYHYGDNGQWTVPQEVRGYADRLTQEPSTAPVERTTYTYDGRGRQVTVDDGTHHVQYAYDALGARIGMDVTTSPGAAPAWGVGTTKYVVDHANPTGYSQILEEVNGAGTVTRRYRIGHDVLSQTTSVATQYFVYDGHGSTRTLVTPQGTAVSGPSGTVQEFDYDAYGNLISNISTQNLATTLLYSGEVTDLVTGQQYLRARYYDPQIGRFNSLDPFAGNASDPQSLHKYAYVHGDPVQGVDPSGREFSVAGISSNIGTALRIGNATLRVARTVHNVASTLESILGVIDFIRDVRSFLSAFANSSSSGIVASLGSAIQQVFSVNPSDFTKLAPAFTDATSFIGNNWNDLMRKLGSKVDDIAADVISNSRLLQAAASHKASGKTIALVINLPSPPHPTPWRGIGDVKISVRGYTLVLRSDKRRGRLFGIEFAPLTSSGRVQGHYNIVRIDYQDFENGTGGYEPHYHVGPDEEGRKGHSVKL